MTPGDGHRTKIAATIAATTACLFVAWFFADRLEFSAWKGKVDEILSKEDEIKKDASTALGVLKDHGAEIQLVRTQIEGLRGEVTATRTELLRAVDKSSGDRFTGTDWEREKQAIEARLDAITERLSFLDRRLTALEKN